MPARFFDYNGKLVPGRRSRQGQSSAGGDMDSPEKIAQALRDVTQRLAELEAIATNPAVEFEVTLPASGIVRFNHGFGGPVRWYPVWSEDTSTTASSTSTSILVADTQATATYKFNYDLSALTRGKYTAAAFLTATAVGNTAGLVFTRGSVSTVQTSASTLDSTPLADEPCIGSLLGTTATTGLVVQSKVKQFFGSGAASTDVPRNLSRVIANGWTAGANSTVNAFPSATLGPDGVNGCSTYTTTHTGTPSVNAVWGYTPYAALSAGTGLTTASMWGGNNGALITGGVIAMNAGSLPPLQQAVGSAGAWARTIMRKGAVSASAFVPGDGRNQVPTAFVPGWDTTGQMDYAQYEHGNFANEAIATSGGTRMHDRLSYANASQLISADAQIKMYLKFIPKGTSADQVNYTDATTAAYSAGRYLWSIGTVGAAPTTYAFIRDSDKKLVVGINGGPQIVSANAIGWANTAGGFTPTTPVMELYVAVGSNRPSVAKWRQGESGAWNDMVMGPVAEVPAPGAVAICFFVNSVITHASGNLDIGAFPMWCQKMAFLDTGHWAGTENTTYTSTSTVTGTRPHSPDCTVNRAQTTANTLALNSYNAIKTVIRVESAQATVSPPLLGI